VTKGRGPKRSQGARRGSESLPEIFWSDRAIADLEAIGDYVARDNPAAAERWVNRLIQTVEKAAVAPLVGRQVPELGRHDIRETYLRKYRIVYRVTADQVEILTVFEGHRLFSGDVDI